MASMDFTGRTIGGCRLERKLGAGAMGSVYQATQISLGRPVALKLLSPELAANGEEFIARFRREAQAVGHLAHPGIVQVHDMGVDGGHYYIVMEFVDGGSLASRIKAGLTVPDACRFARDAALALGEAHQEGILHRDIKPDNILLTRKDRVKVADFGLARCVAEDARLTQAGTVMGTPYYMSPEQWNGGEVGPATDIYALGITLYEALTGQVPFRGSTASIMYQHLSKPAPPVTDANTSLPAALRPILERALAKDPALRHPSAAALASDLDRLAHGPEATSVTPGIRVDEQPTVISPPPVAPPPVPATATPLSASQPAFPTASPATSALAAPVEVPLNPIQGFQRGSAPWQAGRRLVVRGTDILIELSHGAATRMAAADLKDVRRTSPERLELGLGEQDAVRVQTSPAYVDELLSSLGRLRPDLRIDPKPVAQPLRSKPWGLAEWFFVLGTLALLALGCLSGFASAILGEP